MRIRCRPDTQNGDELKQRCGFHWSTFTEEQKRAVICFLDHFHNIGK